MRNPLRHTFSIVAPSILRHSLENFSQTMFRCPHVAKVADLKQRSSSLQVLLERNLSVYFHARAFICMRLATSKFTVYLTGNVPGRRFRRIEEVDGDCRDRCLVLEVCSGKQILIYHRSKFSRDNVAISRSCFFVVHRIFYAATYDTLENSLSAGIHD